MAEPVDRHTQPLQIRREFSGSRVEQELQVHVYGLLVPVFRELVGPSAAPPAEPHHQHLLGNVPSHKGV